MFNFFMHSCLVASLTELREFFVKQVFPFDHIAVKTIYLKLLAIISKKYYDQLYMY